MNPVVFHIAGGDAFFSGLACLGLSIGLGFHGKSWVRQCATVLCLLGLIAVAVSATPLPYWLYAIAAVVSIAWVIIIRPKEPASKHRRVTALLMAGIWLVALGFELPYRFSPTIDYDGQQPVVIYGDSITAGLGEGEAVTWPALLKTEHGVDVRDFSRVGAKVATVLKIIERNPKQAGIVILEIGGNDLLGSTTTADFERDLDRLLMVLSQRHDTVVMFELPLLPFYNEYGRIQASPRKSIRRCIDSEARADGNPRGRQRNARFDPPDTVRPAAHGGRRRRVARHSKYLTLTENPPAFRHIWICSAESFFADWL